MKRTNWKKMYELEKVRAEQAEGREKAAKESLNALVQSDLVMKVTDKTELTDKLMRNVRTLYIAGGEVAMNLKKPFSIRLFQMFSGHLNLGAGTLNIGGWDAYTKERAKNLELSGIIAAYEAKKRKR